MDQRDRKKGEPETCITLTILYDGKKEKNNYGRSFSLYRIQHTYLHILYGK